MADPLVETRTGGGQTLPPSRQMKATNPQNDALGEILRRCRTTAPLPPQFHDSVWRRIEEEETNSDFTFWSGLGAWIENALPRPKIALCYVTALLLMGVASGLLTAQGKSHRMNS